MYSTLHWSLRYGDIHTSAALDHHFGAVATATAPQGGLTARSSRRAAPRWADRSSSSAVGACGEFRVDQPGAERGIDSRLYSGAGIDACGNGRHGNYRPTERWPRKRISLLGTSAALVAFRQDVDMSEVSFSPRVLLMDEDEDVRESLQRGLSLSGFEVMTANDGTGLVPNLAELRPGVVVLNMGVRDLNGLGTLKAVRNFDSDLPVCVLVAPASVDDRVAGLEAGADDYLIKPFRFTQLVARVRALNHSHMMEVRALKRIDIGPIEINVRHRFVRIYDTEVNLTRRECDLLATLAEHNSAALSRKQLLRLAWGYDFDTETDVVDVFVGHLRRKLEAGGAPRLVHSVCGTGFMLGVMQ